ncbi:hypothetical protein H072_2357 [Dactylellina haptotyla CBS 200.50]|uniref:Uncharacterized protein n=1 Tax=Dactylellina haptotyla (strain CBS 200.50) TaxID=1284197 RepID=S8AR73_DACHA|nr:hypothetical protein H072_2357 [Dactylellina haptotyla CBS 200.50]
MFARSLVEVAAIVLSILSTINPTVGQSSCDCSCTADSCLTALLGSSAYPSQATISDCRSFLWTSSTRADLTVTTRINIVRRITETVSQGSTITTTVVTQTDTATTVIPSGTSRLSAGTLNARKRQLTIPAYAANCQNAAAYSSGCRCIGVSASGTTYFYIPTTTITIESTLTMTDTTTVSSDVIETVLTGSTTTLTARPAEETRFRIQITNDVINGPFRGKFLNRINLSGVFAISVVNEADGVGAWAANVNGNFTSIDRIPWSVSDTGEAQQIYNRVPPAGCSAMSCWVKPDLLIQCDTPDRIYIGAANSSSLLRAYQDSGQIFPLGDTGPLILKAVPVSASETDPPPAVAKSVVIRAANVAANGAFAGQYVGISIETTTGIDYYRAIFVTGQANAKIFLVDPVNGNIKSTTNEPFGINSVTAVEQLYSTMSEGLESGHYIIKSKATGHWVGRHTVEDMSPLPKRVVTVLENEEPPKWEITKHGEGYNMKIGGNHTTSFDRRLWSIILPEPIAQDWKIEAQPQHGNNVYAIMEKNGSNGWVVGGEDANEQIHVQTMIIGPSFPPFFPANELFEIIKTDS